MYCDKNGRPFRNVRIHHTIVLDDPFDSPKMIRYPDSPPSINVSTVSKTMQVIFWSLIVINLSLFSTKSNRYMDPRTTISIQIEY